MNFKKIIHNSKTDLQRLIGDTQILMDKKSTNMQTPINRWGVYHRRFCMSQIYIFLSS